MYCKLSTLFLHSGTFDVQGLIIIQNTTSGEVCFHCSPIDGGSAKGCFILYYNLDAESIGSLSVLRTENIKCVTSIIPGNYSISVHDIESGGMVFTSRPAYQTTVRIETLSLTVSFTSSTFSSTLLLSGSSLLFTSVAVTPSSDLTYNSEHCIE